MVTTVVIRKTDRLPVTIIPDSQTSGGVKPIVVKGTKGDKGDDKVYVGISPPNPRGTYLVWIKALPPTG